MTVLNTQTAGSSGLGQDGPLDDPGEGLRPARGDPQPATFREELIRLREVCSRAGLTRHYATMRACLDALIANYRPELNHLVRFACESRSAGRLPDHVCMLLVILIDAEAVRFAERAVRKYFLPADYVGDLAQQVNLILTSKLFDLTRHLDGWSDYGKFQAYLNRIAHNEGSDLADREDRHSGRRALRMLRRATEPPAPDGDAPAA